MANVADVEATLGVNNSQFISGFNQAENKVASFTSTVNSVSRSASALGGKLTRWVTLPILAMGVAAGASAVKTAAGMEQSKIAFTTLLKSAKKADKFISDMKKFAAKTPFELAGLQDSARQMLAFGWNANKILPDLTAIGDAVGAMGGSADSIHMVTRALGQMRTSGRVNAGDMMQLTSQGINAWKYLAAAIDEPISKTRELSENNKLGMDSIKASQIIIEGMQKDFAGSMQTQSETVIGVWSTLKDNVSFIMGDIGAEIIKAFDVKAAVVGMSDWFEKNKVMIVSTINEITTGVKDFINQVKPAAQAVLSWAQANPKLTGQLIGMAALLGPVLIVLGQFAPAIQVFFSLSRAVWALNAAMLANPAGIMATAIAGLMLVLDRLVARLTGEGVFARALRALGQLLGVEFPGAAGKAGGAMAKLMSAHGKGADAASKASKSHSSFGDNMEIVSHDVSSASQSMSTSIPAGLNAGAKGADKAGQQLTDDMDRHFKFLMSSASSSSFSAGANVGAGVKKGVRSTGVGGWLKEMALNWWQGVKDVLGISSPSKKFMEIGKMVVAGFIKGVQSMQTAADKALAGMASQRAGLGAQSAQIGVLRAQAAVNELIKDGRRNTIDYREAMISLAESKLSLTDANNTYAESLKKTIDASSLAQGAIDAFQSAKSRIGGFAPTLLSDPSEQRAWTSESIIQNVKNQNAQLSQYKNAMGMLKKKLPSDVFSMLSDLGVENSLELSRIGGMPKKDMKQFIIQSRKKERLESNLAFAETAASGGIGQNFKGANFYLNIPSGKVKDFLNELQRLSKNASIGRAVT